MLGPTLRRDFCALALCAAPRWPCSWRRRLCAHVGALADEADFQLGRAGVNVLRTEGHDGNRWVLLDYGSVIVHVFTPEAHDFYDLEHLWADAKLIHVPNLD